MIGARAMPEYFRDERLPDLAPGTHPDKVTLVIMAVNHGDRLGLRLDDVLRMRHSAVVAALAEAQKTLGIKPLKTRTVPCCDL